MDAFYASVEQLDHPEFRGKPIAVGGSSERGVIAAASYEARKFGVRSAMSSQIAIKKCPQLIFVKHNFPRYKEVSSQIRTIFLEYTELVEPLSLDEAFLDVTDHENPSASLIAKEIRARIKEETGLNASAGISVNKFVAKIASDINKPNGQKTIRPDQVIPFLEELAIDKFFGVGKVTAQKMKKKGIFTGLDLKQHTEEFLSEHFGKSGKHFYKIVRGIHNSPVSPNRTRKSIAAERTFSENVASEIQMLEKLDGIADELEKRLLKAEIKGKTITLKIKYRDFEQQTRSKTVSQYFNEKQVFFPIVEELIYQDKMNESVRLLGLSVTNLNNKEQKGLSEPISVQLEIDFKDFGK
ncbi:MAG: DNA polymerase-4 [Parvicellaceae bacterium]|jgi:DNA polymerase-4